MPLGLTREDFDAYLPESAGEAAVARVRLSLRQRMLAWGRGVARRLADLDVPVRVAAPDTSSTPTGGAADAQRVVLEQDASGRPDAREGRARLALIVGTSHVEIALELPASASLDVKNLRARLGDPGRNLELHGALEALPEQFTAGLAADPGVPAASLDGAAVLSLLDRSVSTGRALRIGWIVPRDVAVVHKAVLDEQLEDAMVALARVYRLVAWAPDNDLLAEVRVAHASSAEHARSRKSAEREQPSWEERSRARRFARARRREEAAERASSRKVDVDGKRKREPAPASSASRPSAAKPGRPRLPVTPRTFATGLDSRVDSGAPVERGARVRVLAGPFAGKVGVVQELDGKGGAKIMLGLLATSVKVKDLIASVQGKGRPTLSSSHRKRLPAR
jgi:hypothetical protein